MDLEPEGKVFVVITLTGSFTEGKGVTLACSHSELTLVCVPPSVPEQGRCLDSSHADVAEVSGVMGEIWKGLWVAAGAVCALCSGSWVLTLVYFPEVVLQTDCFRHSCFSPGFLLKGKLRREQGLFKIEHVENIWMVFIL